jgi:hypothetical protein
MAFESTRAAVDGTGWSADEREGVDPLTAERNARAVFTALRDAIGSDEYADLRAQLGKDYSVLESLRKAAGRS